MKSIFQRPSCEEHGQLVLDLAQGRLDLEQASVAEIVRRDCPACRSWWQDAFSSELTAVVDQAVAEAFAGFAAPRRRSRGLWLAAVAFLLALAQGIWLFEHHRSREIHGPDAKQTLVDGQGVTKEIFVEGFEEGPKSADRLFENNFESGELSVWSLKG